MTLREKINRKEKLIGAYTLLRDPAALRIVGLSGYDAVWIDTEHSPINSETLFDQILTLRATGTPVFVRVPEDDLTATKRTLEMGIDAIIFPMVKSAEEARRLISYTLYPPEGIRGFGPLGAIDFGISSAFDYLDASKDTLCRFIQIEHRELIECLDEVLEIPYLDGFVFGPNDLAGSYGSIKNALSDEIATVMREAIKKIHAKGKYVVIASGGYSDEVVSHWASFDADMIFAGADYEFIRDGAKKNKLNLEMLFKK